MTVCHRVGVSEETDTEAVDHAAEVRAELCGPGGRWETTTEDVLGVPALVFAGRRRSLRDDFHSNIDSYADRECLVLDDMRLTYTEVGERVAATARRLRELGVATGDRVGILAANCPEWVITFYATISLGGIVAAFNGWWTGPEIDHAVRLADPAVIVA